jgi:hypothetical protein
LQRLDSAGTEIVRCWTVLNAVYVPQNGGIILTGWATVRFETFLVFMEYGSYQVTGINMSTVRMFLA